ncbi:MAG TPA: hypothetical protein ENK21_05875, partial [Trueperaceae bacterium]|nr:hypothetical protein [Trueperaceae bacterium]
SQGPSGFGYGDNDDNTLIPASPSVFIRKSFNISDPSQADGMLIHIDYDDAYALYLNGKLITKKNISDLSLYTEAAKKGHEANLYRGEHDFEEVWIKAEDLRQGENLIAIEAHNYSVDNSAKKDWVEPADLSIIPVVSLFYKYANPNKIDNPSAFVAAAYPHLHSNFSLKSGESVVLSNAQGQVVDKQVLLDTRSNESQGRASNSGTWGYLDYPSPKASNTNGYAKRAAKVKALTSAGLYDAALSLALEAEAGASIYYSLDGSEPNTSSNQYTGPINISKTSILRARAYRNNYAPSLVSSFTYFINEDNGLPIISLIADPIDLFSNQRGIFAYGSHAEANGAGANFKQAWTRASSVEYFLDASLAFQADAGLELFGHYSRSKERKSMEVKFKDGFGSGKLKYPVFDDYPVKKFDDLVLRTSSNDYKKTLFRDMLTQSLFKELGLDTQAYKPARLFINAQYWGLINIREKMDSHYLERHFGVEDDDIDLIAGYIKENGKLKGQVLEGNLDSYRELVNFVKDRDMSD